jgi:hypothetical protein
MLIYDRPGASQDPSDPPEDQKVPTEGTPAVRFSFAVEEIVPDQTGTDSHGTSKAGGRGDPGEVTPEQLRALSKSLQRSNLQERRMSIFAFEPFSLPPSRVRCI